MADLKNQEITPTMQSNPDQEISLQPPHQDSMLPCFDFCKLHIDRHNPCSNCGYGRSSVSGALKRRSPPPSPPSSDPDYELYRPKPAKKLFRDQSDHSVITKFSSPEPPAPVLRRCVSDTAVSTQLPFMDSFLCSSSGSSPKASNQSPQQNITCPNSLTPCSATKGSVLRCARPPLPPKDLRRCVSDPYASPAKTHSRSSSCDETVLDLGNEEMTSVKKLMRIKERVKEIDSWLADVLKEEEQVEPQEREEHLITEDHSTDTDTPKKDSESEAGESMNMQRNGDYTVINFKCSCSKVYHFLVAGNDCYYKLM